MKRSRNRYGQALWRRQACDMLPGMRTRHLLTRSTEAVERLNEVSARQQQSFDRQTESFDRQQQAFERQNAAFDRQNAAFDRQAEASRRDAVLVREAIQANRDITRTMLADMTRHRERMERDSEALIGAVSDLAAEIRSWRDDMGFRCNVTSAERHQHQLELADMDARRVWADRSSDAYVEHINALRRFIKARGPEEVAAAQAEREATEEAFHRAQDERPEPRSAFYRSIDSTRQR